jgi:endonuclease YncB( thermonuclease family)
MRGACALLAAALVLAGPAPLRAELFFDARVVKVLDGDTLEVVREAGPGGGGTRRLRIRISGIDAPERGQPWWRRARMALADRSLGEPVRINAVTTDRWGRTVGEVYADGVCVGCELVRDGHAWVYRRFSDDPVLLALEADARRARRGLWALPEAERLPPWEWRERERRAHAESGQR